MPAYAAKGAKLQRDNGVTFDDIAEVTNLSGPTLSGDTIDVTAHDATGNWKNFLATLLDAGEVTFDLNFDPADTVHLGLWTDLKDQKKQNFKVIFPDAAPTTWSFSGFVTAFVPDQPVEGKLGASCTIKLTGQPTLA